MENKTKVYEINRAKTAVYPMKGIRTVVINVFIRGGSWNEDGKNWGGAHLIEHLLFEGTENLPTWEAMEEYKQQNGISCGATTGGESIHVWFKFPDTHIEQGLWFFEEMVFKSSLNLTNRDKVLGVITQEYRDKWGNPYKRFSRSIQTQLFGKDSPAIRDGMGSVEYIEKLGRDELLKLHHKIFQPQNMVIAVAGNVEPKSIYQKLGEILTKYENGEKLAPVDIKLNIQNWKEVYKDKVDQSIVNINFCKNDIDWGLENGMVLYLGNYILGPRSNSVLFRRFRQEAGIAYSMNSVTWSFMRKTGGVEMWANVDKKNTDMALVIFEDVTRTYLDNLQEEEVKKTINFLNINSVMRYDSPYNVADSMAADLFYEGRVIETQERIEAANKIKVEKVKRSLGEFFKWENAVVSVLEGE